MQVVPHVQTKTEIREVLDRHGIRPRKRHGQHFLIDGNLMRRLAESAELSREDAVLEIGPGTGGLTDLLLESAGRVMAVEIDPAMQAILRERFGQHGRFQLIAGDALAGKHHLAPGVVLAMEAAAKDGVRLKLVANLPYHAATPALANLLVCPTPPDLLVFTVQKEVADRFTARAGSKDYGPLSVLFQVACEVRQIAVVPPTAFWPVPDVESAMLRCQRRSESAGQRSTLAELMVLVHGAFAYRRKTLRQNLRRSLGPEELARAEAEFDLDRRAEELSVAEWVALTDSIHSARRLQKS